MRRKFFHFFDVFDDVMRLVELLSDRPTKCCKNILTVLHMFKIKLRYIAIICLDTKIITHHSQTYNHLSVHHISLHYFAANVAAEKSIFQRNCNPPWSSTLTPWILQEKSLPFIDAGNTHFVISSLLLLTAASKALQLVLLIPFNLMWDKHCTHIIYSPPIGTCQPQ